MLGFVITFFFLILFLIRIRESVKWSYALFYAVVMTLGSFVVFNLLLKTQLPSGFLGF